MAVRLLISIHTPCCSALPVVAVVVCVMLNNVFSFGFKNFAYLEYFLLILGFFGLLDMSIFHLVMLLLIIELGDNHDSA